MEISNSSFERHITNYFTTVISIAEKKYSMYIQMIEKESNPLTFHEIYKNSFPNLIQEKSEHKMSFTLCCFLGGFFFNFGVLFFLQSQT